LSLADREAPSHDDEAIKRQSAHSAVGWASPTFLPCVKDPEARPRLSNGRAVA
jgi:hypothetical protein